jgi:hypothetical protein
MIEVVPFYPEHLKNSSFQRPLNHFFDGQAVSLRDDGRTLGIAGLVSIGGIPKLAGLVSEELKQRPMLLHRVVKKSLPHVIDFFDLPFIEAEVPKNNAISNRWLLSLGFTFQETQDTVNVYRYIKR